MKAVGRHCSQFVHALMRHTRSQAAGSNLCSAPLHLSAIRTLCRAGLLELIAPLKTKAFFAGKGGIPVCQASQECRLERPEIPSQQKRRPATAPEDQGRPGPSDASSSVIQPSCCQQKRGFSAGLDRLSQGGALTSDKPLIFPSLSRKSDPCVLSGRKCQTVIRLHRLQHVRWICSNRPYRSLSGVVDSLQVRYSRQCATSACLNDFRDAPPSQAGHSRPTLYLTPSAG